MFSPGHDEALPSCRLRCESQIANSYLDPTRLYEIVFLRVLLEKGKFGVYGEGMCDCRV